MVQAEMYDRMASITLSYYVSEDVAQRILSQVDIEERYKYENYTAWYYDEITDREYYYSIVGGKVQVEAYIGFGPNCTNIIQTLIECEVIDSVDVFEWE